MEPREGIPALFFRKFDKTRAQIRLRGPLLSILNYQFSIYTHSMTILQSLLLGAIEGVTEFLPISSTGHLILAGHLLKIPSTEFVKSFEIAIQLGAILAALVLYWKTLLLNRKILMNVIIAFIPTAIIGLLLHGIVKEYLLGNDHIVIASLFLGGIILILFEKMHHPVKTRSDLTAMTPKQAVAIGLAQSIAIIPGVSRSAATIVGGMLLGFERKAIVDFSFLLAIPTMAAATGFDLLKSASTFTSDNLLVLVIGFIVSFITAILAIKWLLGFIKHHTFIPFGVYRMVVAGIYFLFLF
jgi:undecaprenyl-diphosphatase